jgi:glycosyltransferase involved in cell wall biosynthesis
MGRLMRDKGVGEYVAAARRVRARWPEAHFLLLGRPETENPTGYTAEEMQAWQDEGLVDLLAETRDVRPCLASAHVFVLPSYYREGLPRTILEALATGRPVITTDMPGCREPIEQGRNGFLVPPRDVDALSDAMERFLECPSLLQPMGEAARRSAVDIYDVERVNRQLLVEMEVIGPDPMPSPSSLQPLNDTIVATA